MGVAAILVMWPGPFEQTFVPASLVVSIWNLSLIGQVVSEEKMFEIVDGRRSDWYTISSPMSLGSGELKISKLINRIPGSRL